MILAEVALLELDDPRWTSIVRESDHDVYHLPEFLAAEDAFRGTTTQLLVVAGGTNFLAVPIILNQHDAGQFDATSPQSYASPIFSPGASVEWREQAIRELLGFLKAQGVVSLFLRFHPLFPGGLETFAEFGAVKNEGQTYVIPLAESLDVIRRNMRENHRRNIRKGKQSGLTVEFDRDWAHLDEFQHIYTLTMERLGAHPKHFYTREYFDAVRNDVPGASLWVLKAEDALAGAHIVTECDGTVQYFLGASNTELQQRIPQILLFDAVLEWAHERGNENYFLTGGMQDSLLHFKAGLTRETRPFYTARIVVDPVAYGRLCGEWESRTGRRVAAGMDAFFPAYRQP